MAIVNCSSMNIEVHRFFSIGVSGFLGYSPSSGIARSKGSSIFSFPYCFPQWLHQPAFPPTVHWGSLFSAPLPALVCGIVNDGHSDRCEVVSHCVFNLHFSDG